MCPPTMYGVPRVDIVAHLAPKSPVSVVCRRQDNQPAEHVVCSCCVWVAGTVPILNNRCDVDQYTNYSTYNHTLHYAIPINELLLKRTSMRVRSYYVPRKLPLAFSMPKDNQ